VPLDRYASSTSTTTGAGVSCGLVSVSKGPGKIGKDPAAIKPFNGRVKLRYKDRVPLRRLLVKQAKMISVILVSIGMLLLIVAGIFLGEDVGSCPASGNCDHTFPGTDIYIMPVVHILEILSLISIGSAIVLFLRNRAP
jgi:hypothetical protein